jgi:uncharacterized protein (DUF433 family)
MRENINEGEKVGKERNMEWMECPEIEAIPGKMGGVPVIKGTRITPETVVTDYELGSPVEEIHENFPSLPLDTIRKVIAFAHAEQPQPR